MTQDIKNISQRKVLFLVLGLVVGLCSLSYGLYYALFGSSYISTDNAYVGAEVIHITPSLTGTVQKINCKDTDWVKAGYPLVMLDPLDFQLALASAQADLEKAQVDFEGAKADYERRLVLQKSNSVSEEDVRTTRNAFRVFQALLGKAEVSVQQAKIELTRTTLTAPVQGIVAKRQVQIGQRVQAGTPLMAIVPMDQVYVNANFKESQMRDIQIGQPVELISDVYGSSVVFHGTVTGISGGTGSAFALIPAQNATGNWVKVVQRLPVRIALNPQELKQHPLQMGLSMKVTVHISKDK